MEQAVVFKNSNVDKLNAILSDDNSSKPVVIFAHGLGSSKDSGKYIDFQRILNRKGISVFRFDFYGHGESDGKLEDITLSEGTDDILQAIIYLKDKGFTKIGLVGTSFGGICSIMAASESSDLKFLGLIAPVSCPEEMPDLSNHADASKLKTSLNNDTENNGLKIADHIKIPVYILHGDQDDVVPLEQSLNFCKVLNNGKLEIIKGADHQMRDPVVYEKVLRLMTDFISGNI